MHKIKVKVSINGKEVPGIQEPWANISAGGYSPGLHLMFKCPISSVECIENAMVCADLSAEIQINNMIFICPPSTVIRLETGLNGRYGHEDKNPDAFTPYMNYWHWDMEVRSQIKSRHTFQGNSLDPDVLIKVLKAPEQSCLI